MKSKPRIGQQAEQLAKTYLLQHGLTFITQNYYCRRGEIDLIMQDEQSLVFVEVRYRKSSTFGSALESVDRRKQTKLIVTAEHYLQQNTSAFSSCRFDVIAITVENDTPSITWLKDAFQTNY